MAKTRKLVKESMLVNIHKATWSKQANEMGVGAAAEVRSQERPPGKALLWERMGAAELGQKVKGKRKQLAACMGAAE